MSSADKNIAAISEVKNRTAAQRASEAVLFVGVILISSVAVIAVAVAAPFVLAASAISGFFAGKTRPRGWRAANI